MKGCGRRFGIPDLYCTEVAKSPKSLALVADELWVVYFDRKPPQLCKIKREKIKSEFFKRKISYRISSSFKNPEMLGGCIEKRKRLK